MCLKCQSCEIHYQEELFCMYFVKYVCIHIYDMIYDMI